VYSRRGKEGVKRAIVEWARRCRKGRSRRGQGAERAIVEWPRRCSKGRSRRPRRWRRGSSRGAMDV